MFPATLCDGSNSLESHSMRLFFDARQLAHAPLQELHNGAFVPYAETPARARAFCSGAQATEAPADHGEGPILRVHDAGYIAYLKTAHTRWVEAGRPGDVLGYIWPVVGRRALDLSRIDALAGLYSMDSSTPLTADSWTSAYWSTQCALSALDAVLAGDKVAVGLCRPPGHHAGADYLGGYCFINQAAVAAQAARDAGIERVAILDIDYHHGNGTQDIFWDRGDVFYASVHADPATDFPLYWGHADEVGEGDGVGATLNLPLPQGTGLAAFRAAQAKALEAIAKFAPGLLIVSFGADTFAGDPIANFALQTSDYAALASDIVATGLPTVVLTEGGYAVDNLGDNLASFFSGC
jgi:acetoin utilization deacetylase AcuC-like enzyme